MGNAVFPYFLPPFFHFAAFLANCARFLVNFVAVTFLPLTGTLVPGFALASLLTAVLGSFSFSSTSIVLWSAPFLSFRLRGLRLVIRIGLLLPV